MWLSKVVILYGIYSMCTVVQDVWNYPFTGYFKFDKSFYLLHRKKSWDLFYENENILYEDSLFLKRKNFKQKNYKAWQPLEKTNSVK